MIGYAADPLLAADPARVAELVRRRTTAPGAALIVGAVVDAFVARVVRCGGEDAVRDELLAWIGELGSSYGDVAELRVVLENLPYALAVALRELTGCAIPLDEVDALEHDVRTAVTTFWRPLARVTDEPLDEVDARISTLIVRLEARDPLTSEHSRAVSAWCSRISRRLGLSAPDVTFMARCGLLHDVGKVVTPLEVLNAPRALDPAEWTVMRAHAAAGEAMVRKIPALRPFAPAVRSHHERLDGKGYPDGLPASAIPLAARIVAVADCFNAMIGRRPYRLPLSPTRALEELDRNRATQFDPEIVDAMIELIRDKGPKPG